MLLDDLLSIFPFEETKILIVDIKYREIQKATIRRSLYSDTVVPSEIAEWLPCEVAEFYPSAGEEDVVIRLWIDIKEHTEYKNSTNC